MKGIMTPKIRKIIKDCVKKFNNCSTCYLMRKLKISNAEAKVILDEYKHELMRK